MSFRNICLRFAVVLCAVMAACEECVMAQTNCVLTSGDTMTGTLSFDLDDAAVPAIQILGSSSDSKYLHFESTDSGTVWVISHDPVSQRMAFYFTPEGDHWTTPLYIGTNGVLYGNGAGLTDLNVSIAIPDGSITSDKVSSDVITSSSLTNGGVQSLSVGGFLGFIANNVGESSMAVGFLNSAYGQSFAVGQNCEALGVTSFASGYCVSALGDYSHAEGRDTEASGNWSHAEGWGSIASGIIAHAEGWLTVASGCPSHAEGNRTIASGAASHAEGYDSEAIGSLSHASGYSAKAVHNYAYVWSSGSEAGAFDFESTTNRQFSVYADNGIVLVPGDDAVVKVKGRLEAESIDLSNIGVYGDISMGSFTNTAASN